MLKENLKPQDRKERYIFMTDYIFCTCQISNKRSQGREKKCLLIPKAIGHIGATSIQTPHLLRAEPNE